MKLSDLIDYIKDKPGLLNFDIVIATPRDETLHAVNGFDYESKDAAFIIRVDHPFPRIANPAMHYRP